MSLDPITALLDIGTTIINKVWPDPAQQAEAQAKLQKLAQEGDLARIQAEVQLLLGQMEINKIDAASSNWFQSGWRPSIGWVGSLSLALMYIPKALVMTYIWTYQSITILAGWDGVSALAVPAFPDLGVSDIIGLLMSMLGVAAMRSYDKRHGTDSK